MIARIDKVAGKYPWLVYVQDRQVVGYVYASAHRERAAYQWSTDVSVYVHPAYQRRNIGRGLYTALFALLRGQGFVNAYAGIALPNAASVGVHEAMGFVPLGVYRQVGYKLGAWHDVGWWVLQLTVPPPHPAPPRPIRELMGTPLWADALQRGLADIR
jgi:phosphinothricin acetyltransferase